MKSSMNSSRKGMMVGFGLSVATLFLASGASAAPFQGETVETTAAAAREIRVAYGDLDLSNPVARETLNRRIERAADQVCGKADLRRSRGLAQAREIRACLKEAVNAAHRQIPQPMVSGLQ